MGLYAGSEVSDRCVPLEVHQARKRAPCTKNVTLKEARVVSDV